MNQKIKNLFSRHRTSHLTLSLLGVLLSGTAAQAQWVKRSNTNFPAPTVPGWHWFGNFNQNVDTNMSTHFDGPTLKSSWQRRGGYDGSGRISHVTGQRFPFKFSFWESESNFTSQLGGGNLNLRCYWNQGFQTWLGGWVETKQPYADGFFQVRSHINLSEAGWVHGFWMTLNQREIDIYEIKGIGQHGADERNQMPLNVHHFEFVNGTRFERLPGFGGAPTIQGSAANWATYGLLKSANYLEYFANNRIVRRIDNNGNFWLNRVMRDPQNVILNIEYQPWVGDPSNKSAIARHTIDYVARYMW